MKTKTARCKLCGHRASGIFCGLAGAHLANLDEKKTVHTYRPGQVIFNEEIPPLPFIVFHRV